VAETILVVDDDFRLAKALVLRLRAVGYAPTHAGCGLQAVDEACKVGFSAIVLDIRLPDMTGFAVCERIRQSECNRSTPVLFLSGNSSADDRRTAMKAGGNEFLAKPCPADTLVSAIRRLCATRAADHEPGLHHNHAAEPQADAAALNGQRN
jgi:DNA-binding response OmpR family regulator